MKKKVSLYIIVFFLFFMASAQASQVDVYYPNTNQEIQYVNPDHAFLMQINLKADMIDDAQAVRVETNRASDQRPMESCSSTSGCNMVLAALPNNELEVSFDVIYLDQNEDEISRETVTKSFSEDSENPSVEDVQTSHCDEETCYVSSRNTNELEVQMESTPSGYDFATIQASIQGNTYQSVSCDGNTCSILVDVSCSDEQEITATILQESTDSAKNELSEPFSTSLTCISSAPQIQDFKVESSRNDDVFTIIDPFTITANVTHPISPSLTGLLNASSINAQPVTSQCTYISEDDVHRCTVTTTSNLEVPGEGFELIFEVEDVVGNKDGRIFTVDLDQVDGQTTPNFWEYQSTSQPVSRLNKRNLASSRELPATFTFRSNQNNLELLDVTQAGTCRRIHDPDGGNDVNSIRLVETQDNKAHVMIEMIGAGNRDENRYTGYDSLSYECPLNLVSRAGNTIYSRSEQVNVSFGFSLSDNQYISQNVRAEINRTRNSIERRNNRFQAVRENIQTIRSICNGYASASRGVAGMGLAHEGLAFSNQQLGGALDPAVQTSSRTLSRFETGVQEFGSNVIPICEMMACNASWQSSIIDSIGAGDPDVVPWPSRLSDVTGSESFSDSLDPFRSEIVAWGQVCVPAILHHQNVRQEIDCGYQYCLEQQVLGMGVPQEYCSYQRGEQLCRHQATSLKNAIPYANLFDGARENIAMVVGNPVEAIVGAIGLAACDINLPFGIGEGSCRAVNALKSVQYAVDLTTQMGGAIGLIDRGAPVSMCDRTFDDLDRYVSAERLDRNLRTTEFGQFDASQDFEESVGDRKVQSRPGEFVLPDEGVRVLMPAGYLEASEENRLDPALLRVYNLDGEFVDNYQNYAIESGDAQRYNDILRWTNQKELERRQEMFNSMGPGVGDSYRDLLELQRELADLQDSTVEEESLRNRKEQLERQLSFLEEGAAELKELNNALDESGINQDQQKEREMGAVALDRRIAELERQLEQIEGMERKEEIQNELEEAQEQLERELKAEENEMRRDYLVGNAARAIRSYFGSVRGLTALTSIGGLSDNWNSWGANDLADEIMDYTPMVDALCESNLNPFDYNDDFEPRTTTLTSGGFETVSSFITATRTDLGDGTYEYFISNAVNRPLKELRFRIILEGGRGTVDITPDLFEVEQVSVPAGGTQGVFPNPQAVQTSSSHERACIEFLVNEDIENYFFSVNDLPNNKLCQRVIAE